MKKFIPASTKSPMNSKRSGPRFSAAWLFLPALFASLSLVSCAKKQTRLVLRTNNVEFVSIAELYNASQDKARLVVHFQEEPAKNLSAKNSEKPDILAGSCLSAEMENKSFARLNSMLKKNGPLGQSSFYPALLQSGRLGDNQYLIPVSFNLPALVFYSENYESLQDAAMLSFDDIKSLSQKFNSQRKDGVWNSMGFGPLWSADFLYLIFKDAGVFFNVGANSISYTENLFLKTSDFVRDWIQQVNGGAKNEQDFAFKYLYMPFYSQVQSGRCLFSYATSRQILSLPKDRVHDLDFRWICNDNRIQIEDDYVSVGIYAKSKNKAAAKKFIAWLMSEYTQKQILDRKAQMNLATNDFGIAGGFSALQSVTERLFPLYYRSLLSNTPVADRLCAPQKFPSDWARVKSAAVEPFILDSVGGSSGNYPTLSERYEALLASEGK